MALGLLGVVGDLTVVVDMLAGAGLGSLAANLVIHSARRRHIRIDARLITARWSVGCAIVALLLYLLAELTS